MSNLRKTSVTVPAYAQALRFSAEIMRALAHPLRMQIITFIDSRDSACVSDIHAGLNIEQSLVSQHLRVLRQAGLVNTNRIGKFVHYTLDYDRLEKAASVAAELHVQKEAVEV